MVPKDWDGGLAGWKRFKEDMEKYVLMKTKKIEEKMDKVKEDKGELMTMTTDEDLEGNEIMISFKSKAGGKAKKILEGVMGDRDYDGWRRLHWQYDKKMTAKAVEVEMRFSSMGGERATSTNELKNMLIEFEARS